MVTQTASPPVSSHRAPHRSGSRFAWWVSPVLVAVGLAAFILYSIWSALQGAGYSWGPYVSPIYSPFIQIAGLTISPALLVVWVPAGLRATCYYYRKAYYRAFFWDPPACARDETWRKGYRGETTFPFILNNFHRYFLYLALVVLFFLGLDTIRAFMYRGSFYLGLGSIIFLVNWIFLANFTFGCHSLRHLVGGGLDCYNCAFAGKTRHSIWSRVTSFNQHHMLWAWCSLATVMATDIYVRLLAAGVMTDPHIF